MSNDCHIMSRLEITTESSIIIQDCSILPSESPLKTLFMLFHFFSGRRQIWKTVGGILELTASGKRGLSFCVDSRPFPPWQRHSCTAFYLVRRGLILDQRVRRMRRTVSLCIFKVRLLIGIFAMVAFIFYRTQVYLGSDLWVRVSVTEWGRLLKLYKL